MLREDAYRLVQGHAMQAWRTDGDFRLSIQKDATVARHLSETQLAHAFSLERQLKNVHAIFDRVFQLAS
jgi:adenylosuccinate lyase